MEEEEPVESVDKKIEEQEEKEKMSDIELLNQAPELRLFPPNDLSLVSGESRSGGKEAAAQVTETEIEERKNEEIDNEIRSQSEEAQAAFLQGAIPKVIFKHAMKGETQIQILNVECQDPSLPGTFLQISYELGNVFVEQFVLQSLLDDHWDVSFYFSFLSQNLSIWHDLITYPVSRILAELSSDDGSFPSIF